MQKQKPSSSCCPVYKIIESLSKKWTMHIMRSMADNKTMRFSEIKKTLPEINSRILSERLSELESEGLLERRIITDKPVCIEYKITEKGMDLRKVFDCFCKWAKKWGSDSECA